MARKKKIGAAPMPAPDGTTYITVTGEILQETDAAILISCEGEEYWLPISQIEYVGGKGDGDVAISVPEWLADEKGLYHGMGETPETSGPVPSSVEKDCTTCGHVAVELAMRRDDEHGFVVKCPKCGEEQPYELNPQGNLSACPVCGEDMPETPEECFECSRNVLLEAEEGDDIRPDNWQPRGRIFGHNVTWSAEEAITVTQPLTEAEKLEYGQEMADALSQIEIYEDELDAQRKHYKRLIEAEEKRAKDASRLYLEGKEEREITCDVLKDWNTMEMVWTEAAPPHAEVYRRPMTEKEKQLSLLDTPTKPVKPIQAGTEAHDGEPDVGAIQ
ncbi:hypothetical protein DDE01_06680 [Desulfovibrio desulfuricans]|nr:hypothetical protein DDE01_06680 [Desulfovibrio desulfuricans]